MHWNKHYFLVALILFLAEVFIAVYIRDAFVRPFLGDMIVVILVYTFLKAFVKIHVLQAALVVWIFVVLVEISQHFNLIKFLGFHNSEIGKAVLGNSFSWMDILMYSIGILLILFVEEVSRKGSVLNRRRKTF